MASQKTTSEKSDPSRYKRLADYLQQSRRNRRISIRKIAQSSSLPESTIRALENPKRSTLPKSNVMGLYQLYAETLEIPESKVTKLAGKADEDKPHLSLKRLPKLKSHVVFSKVGITMFVVISLVGVLSYAAWQSFGLVSSPNLVVEFPDTEYLVIDESQIEVKGSAQKESTVLINGEPTTVSNQDGEFSETIYLQAGYNYITVEAVNSFSTSTIQNFVIIYQPSSLPA